MSEVWKYFKKISIEGKVATAECQVEVETEDGTQRICGRLMKSEGGSTSGMLSHLNRLHEIYPKKIPMHGGGTVKSKKPKTPRNSTWDRPRARTYDDDSDEIMDDIVSLVTAGRLPIETVENESFQRILTKAQRNKKRRTYYKIPEVRTAIREGLEAGTVKMNAIEPSQVNVKSEGRDESNLVNEVWLQNSEHSDYQEESESDETNSSDDAPLRPSRPSTSSKKIESENLEIELITMLLSSSSPFELIDNPSFKNFVKELNPNYQLPRSEILKEKIISTMKQTKKS